MLEAIAMCVALAGMGIYFVKSTDLPKDMKERSAQFRAGTPAFTPATKKYSFPVVAEPKQAVEVKVEEKIEARASIQESLDLLAKEKLMEEEAKLQARIILHNQKIDQITLLITTLEQQLKENHEKNAIIQKQINLHLETLQALKLTKIS